MIDTYASHILLVGLGASTSSVLLVPAHRRVAETQQGLHVAAGLRQEPFPRNCEAGLQKGTVVQIEDIIFGAPPTWSTAHMYGHTLPCVYVCVDRNRGVKFAHPRRVKGAT